MFFDYNLFFIYLIIVIKLKCYGSIATIHGEVGEWLKSPLSKSGRLERASRVQIPPSPQKSTRMS